MSTFRYPVVLVHGWKSHPGIWNHLVHRLEEEDAEIWNFDHSGLDDTSFETVAGSFAAFLEQNRKDRGYPGPVDIICHSVGTCIVRYLFEVMDRNFQYEKVRQLIGIGAPNNGSALAELFCHPVHGPAIIRKLSGIFVPRTFDPFSDTIVQQVRPGSPAMARMRAAGTRQDIAYRVLCGANPAQTPEFFPPFGGKTCMLAKEGGCTLTWEGDGIVAHEDSRLPGIPLEILPDHPEALGERPGWLSHIQLPRSPEIVGRVIGHLGSR